MKEKIGPLPPFPIFLWERKGHLIIDSFIKELNMFLVPIKLGTFKFSLHLNLIAFLAPTTKIYL